MASDLPHLQRAAIRALHAANAASTTRLVVFAAGAGARGAAALLCEPGASKSVLEVRAPYAREAFLDSLAPASPAPASFSSREAALELARGALARARSLLEREGEAGAGMRGVGVAAAGALATLPLRRGIDKIFVARVDDEAEELWETSFAPSGADAAGGCESAARAAQEECAGAAVVLAAASTRCGDTGVSTAAAALKAEIAAAAVTAGASFSASPLARVPSPLARLLSLTPVPRSAVGAGELITHVLFRAHGGAPVANAFSAPARPRILLVPGSFNPLHAGHIMLTAAAARAAPGALPVLELSAENVDKAPLDETEVVRRVSATLAALASLQVGNVMPAGSGDGGGGSIGGAAATGEAVVALSARPIAGIIITRAARFAEKAALFPGADFAVGFDTAARLVLPKYYAGGDAGMRAVLREMRETGTRVFVAGRADANGVFCTLGKDLRVVDDAEGMLIEIDEGACRVDVSSTSIRAAEAAAHR